MNNHPRYSDRPRSQMVWFSALSVLVLIATVGAASADPDLFQRFFGSVSPIGIILAAICVGGLSAWYLSAGAGILVLAPGVWARGLLFSAICASLFALPTIFVDVIAPFPEGLNVGLPSALFYYPVMGFVVEVLFHLLPLSVFLFLATCLTIGVEGSHRFWICALMVAALEPAFQVWVGVTAQGWSWKSVYLGVHLFLFGVVQMFILRRFGFMHMFLFRMVYYLHWHILWGTLRLSLLF